MEETDGQRQPRVGRARDRGAQGAVRVLTQSERLKEGFLGKETSETCRTTRTRQVKKGETYAKAMREDSKAHPWK